MLSHTPAMAKHRLLLQVLFLTASVLHAATAVSPATTLDNSTTPSAYDALARYNFPRGILPEGVTGYLLRPDGSFEVYLPGECDFVLLKQYKLRYGSSIGGTIKTGSIQQLWGVSVQVLFEWIGVNEIDRVDNQLKFEVGTFVQSFPVDNFTASPRCNV